MELRVHGARGSAPVAGREFERYGGHTTCFEIPLPGGQRLIVDCGSGFPRLTPGMERAADEPPFEATLLLTHVHWDHIQGLPFLRALYDPSTRLHIVAAPPEGMRIDEAIEGVMRPPWFPVRFRDVAAHVSFEEASAAPLKVGSLEVSSMALPHPGGVTGYRISDGTRALVIATDVELVDAAAIESVRELAGGAAVLLHDAQYTPAEYPSVRSGWGHSTWEHATEVARLAGVERLVLTSHDPSRTDDGVDAIVAAARKRFASTEGAFEGQVIKL